MTKFVIGAPQGSDVMYIAKEGNLETPSLEANIEYKIGCGDDDIKLNIDGQYLDLQDIDFLIDFLKAAKEELQK